MERPLEVLDFAHRNVLSDVGGPRAGQPFVLLALEVHEAACPETVEHGMREVRSGHNRTKQQGVLSAERKAP